MGKLLIRTNQTTCLYDITMEIFFLYKLMRSTVLSSCIIVAEDVTP